MAQSKLADITMPDGSVMRDVPMGTPKAEVLRRWENATRKPPVDFKLGTAISSVPDSALEYGKNVINAVTHPGELVGAAAGLIQSGMDKAGRKAAEFIHSDRLRDQGGENVVPGGVMKGDMPGRSALGGLVVSEGEAMADGFAAYAKDRWGSLDALKTTIMNDPVGALADVSGVGMLAKGTALAKVAAAVEPLNVALNVGVKVGGKIVSSQRAIDIYQSAAKFTTSKGAAKRDGWVKTALKHGIALSREGVNAVQTKIDDLNQQMNVKINNAGSMGRDLPAKDIWKYISELEKKLNDPILEGLEDLQTVRAYVSKFKNNQLKGRTTMSAAEVQNFKVTTYDKINWDSAKQTGDSAVDMARKAMGRGAKDLLNKAIPGVEGINKQLAELYSLRKPLSQAAARVGNRDSITLGAVVKMTAAGGAATQFFGPGVGTIVAITAAVLSQPATKVRFALALNKIKMGDVKWLTKNISATEVRLALQLAGRTENLEDITDAPADEKGTQ